ncbi:MAG: M23 family metallopeptidase [Bacteroidia bacterium]
MVFIPLYMQKRFFIFLLFSLLFSGVYAQSNYPQNYFRPPVDTNLSLAGNFGEIRPNHFHAGFDIRTNNREGMPVYAAADGYISRIKISPYGYGNALYITHPNGFTTVYGHLKSFNAAIQNFERDVQYNKESFEIDTLLSPDKLPVKKGDLIALSGNTGGSQGPHLHFEIRDSKTESPINPYLFGFFIPDTVPPRITQIAIYPMDKISLINGKNEPKKIAPIYKKGKYSLLKTDTLIVQGDIGFGIECYDTETKSNNKNAVYSIELQSGGKRIYYYEMEKFSFENARYVNAHIDYPSKQRHDTKIQKCFLSKNNQLGIYKNVLNDGIINFTDDSVHWIRYIVKDYFGNSAELMLKIKSRSNHKIQNKIKQTGDNFFDCQKENQFKNEEIQITIPPYALYDDIQFTYSKPGSVKGSYSPLYQIMTDETALQKSYALSIKTIKLPDHLQAKSCIISVNDKGKKSYEGGTYQDGWVNTKTNVFGNFTITVDTIAPKIRTAFPLPKGSTVNLSKAKTIGVIATDNLSGIKKYRATIDGKWVLMEYEMKQNLLFYTFNAKISSGVHTFKIDVTDDKENTSTIQFSFKR